MRQTILLLSCLLFCLPQLRAQLPPTSNFADFWNVNRATQAGLNRLTYRSALDTTIDGIPYYRIYGQFFDSTGLQALGDTLYPFGIRIDSAERVFIRWFEDSLESPLYDFSLEVNEIFSTDSGPVFPGAQFRVTNIDTINVQNGIGPLRRYELEAVLDGRIMTWIEYVGTITNPFYLAYPTSFGGDPAWLLECAYRQGDLVYGDSSGNCVIRPNNDPTVSRLSFTIVPTPRHLYLEGDWTTPPRYQLIDPHGSILLAGRLESERISLPTALSAGLYVLRLQAGQRTGVRRFLYR